MLTCLSSLPSSRALLEGKSVENPIQGTWASVHETYVVVVTATTLLLKLDAQVHDWASKGTSLGGRARLLSWLFSLLRCKMLLILPKRLYGVILEWTIFLLNEEHGSCDRGFGRSDSSGMEVFLQESVQLLLRQQGQGIDLWWLRLRSGG